jgi:aminopeptidase S
LRRSAGALLGLALALTSAVAARAQTPPSAERHAVSSHPRPRGRTLPVRANAPDAIADAGFESGGFRYWLQCGNVNASITLARAHGGKYTQKSGSSAGEPNGDEGVCQAVTIPAGAKLTFWVYQYSNEPDTTFAYQEAQLFDAGGTTVKQLYQTVSTTNGWVQQSYDLAANAGQTLFLYFGVHGDGYAGTYTIQFVDDVTLTSGSGS